MLILQITVVLVVVLGVIIFLLRTIFYQHFSSAMKKMQDLHNQNLEKEVSLNKELEKVLQERQKESAKGKEEAEKIKNTARQEVDKFKEQMLNQAKQETDMLLKEAAQECQRLKNDLAVKAHESAKRLAITIIQEIFSPKAMHALERELIDELITQLPVIDKDKAVSNIKKAQVLSAYPVSDTQREALREKLYAVTGQHIELEEKIDDSIISGLVINLGGIVLDGSLSNKIDKIIPYLEQKNTQQSNAGND